MGTRRVVSEGRKVKAGDLRVVVLAVAGRHVAARATAQPKPTRALAHTM